MTNVIPVVPAELGVKEPKNWSSAEVLPRFLFIVGLLVPATPHQQEQTEIRFFPLVGHVDGALQKTPTCEVICFRKSLLFCNFLLHSLKLNPDTKYK